MNYRFVRPSYAGTQTMLFNLRNSMCQGLDTILVEGRPRHLGQYLEWAEVLGYTVKIKPKEWVLFEKVKESQSPTMFC